jgi:hypothetical protein
MAKPFARRKWQPMVYGVETGRFDLAKNVAIFISSRSQTPIVNFLRTNGRSFGGDFVLREDKSWRWSALGL